MNEELINQFSDMLASTRDDNDLADIVESLECNMAMGKDYTEEAIADDLSNLDLRRDLQDYDRLQDLFGKAAKILREKAKRDKPIAKPQDILEQLKQVVVKSREVDDSYSITPEELLKMQSAIMELDGFFAGYRDQFLINYAAK